MCQGLTLVLQVFDLGPSGEASPNKVGDTLEMQRLAGDAAAGGRDRSTLKLKFLAPLCACAHE